MDSDARRQPDPELIAHERTYHAINVLLRWCMVALASSIFGLTLWFATPAGFLLRSAGILGLCLLVYLLPLLPAALLTGAAPAPLLLLAAVLWTALLLQAFGAAWPSAAICLAAAGGAGTITLLRLPPGDLALSVCCAAAALCLVACALRLLGRPAPHA